MEQMLSGYQFLYVTTLNNGVLFSESNKALFFSFLFFRNRAGLGSLVAEEMKIPNRFVGLSKCKELISQIYEL